MNVTVIYATKTGTTREAARMLADKLRARGARVELCELGRDEPTLSADAYVVGGSVRMGQWHKRARAFVASRGEALARVPVAIFACRCGMDDTRALLAPQLGEPLAGAAVWVGSLGGKMDIEKQRGLDRLVAKLVARSPQSDAFHADGLMPEQADALVAALLGPAEAGGPACQP